MATEQARLRQSMLRLHCGFTRNHYRYHKKLLTRTSGLTTQTLRSLHFSPTSRIFASMEFFFTLCACSSRCTVSTMPCKLLVASPSIRESRCGRCASGNAVLGVSAARLGVPSVEPVELDGPEGREVELEDVLVRCGGRAGMTKPSVVWLAPPACCSIGSETNVKGSIGNGVSGEGWR